VPGIGGSAAEKEMRRLPVDVQDSRGKRSEGRAGCAGLLGFYSKSGTLAAGQLLVQQGKNKMRELNSKQRENNEQIILVMMSLKKRSLSISF